MRRYRIGDIQPEWRSPAPPRPSIIAASDRTGFGVLAEGGLSIYRLAYPSLTGNAVVEGVRTAELGPAKLFALGPGARTLAVALGPAIEISEEGKGPTGSLLAAGDVVALAYSASGKTLWAVVQEPGQKQAQVHAWDAATSAPLGAVAALGFDGSVYELVTHPDPKLERAGVDAAAGQDGSSFTFVERDGAKVTVLPGSHDGDDGVALGGFIGEGALLISREAAVVIDVKTEDRLAGPARATLKWMNDEMIFDYQRGYIDNFWAVSGRFDDRDPDEADQRAPEDVPEGRLRIYDMTLKEVLEMPATDDPYDTPWAVVGLAQQRLLVCQADAIVLYNLRSALAL